MAYALDVQERAVQELQESSTNKQIVGSFPAYRLEKKAIEGFLKQRFSGRDDFNLQVLDSLISILLTLLDLIIHYYSSITISTFS